ncbi:MAG: hypothetical protein AVDCRST_MAG26-3420, partial [uncultured Chloroflexia bacterium]
DPPEYLHLRLCILAGALPPRARHFQGAAAAYGPRPRGLRAGAG